MYIWHRRIKAKFKISDKMSNRHFTIPWGHSRAFVNDTEATRDNDETEVVHPVYIHTTNVYNT